MKLNEIIKGIKKTDLSINAKAQQKIDLKTKPQGSLGVLEDIAVKMSMIQNNLNPVIDNKVMTVFAADHGIATEGVSAYPKEVTRQMVYNFLNNGAAINVLCRHNGININIIDMGVDFDFPCNINIINKKIQKGTKDFSNEESMSEEDAILSVQSGIDVFEELNRVKKIDIIGLGDMGIGNTASSSAIISAATGIAPAETTGRGTGINDSTLSKKIKMIETALAKHKPDKTNGIDILKKVGGFEIGGIAGAILAACYHKTAVVIDGIISTAGALIAYLLNNKVADYLFAGHKSVEIGQTAALNLIGIEPLLDLKMRLGEGTGASLAINIIEAACKIMTEMASFEDAGVSQKSEQKK